MSVSAPVFSLRPSLPCPVPFYSILLLQTPSLSLPPLIVPSVLFFHSQPPHPPPRRISPRQLPLTLRFLRAQQPPAPPSLPLPSPCPAPPPRNNQYSLRMLLSAHSPHQQHQHLRQNKENAQPRRASARNRSSTSTKLLLSSSIPKSIRPNSSSRSATSSPKLNNRHLTTSGSPYARTPSTPPRSPKKKSSKGLPSSLAPTTRYVDAGGLVHAPFTSRLPPPRPSTEDQHPYASSSRGGPVVMDRGAGAFLPLSLPRPGRIAQIDVPTVEELEGVVSRPLLLFFILFSSRPALSRLVYSYLPTKNCKKADPFHSLLSFLVASSSSPSLFFLLLLSRTPISSSDSLNQVPLSSNPPSVLNSLTPQQPSHLLCQLPSPSFSIPLPPSTLSLNFPPLHPTTSSPSVQLHWHPTDHPQEEQDPSFLSTTSSTEPSVLISLPSHLRPPSPPPSPSSTSLSLHPEPSQPSTPTYTPKDPTSSSLLSSLFLPKLERQQAGRVLISPTNSRRCSAYRG